MRNFSLINSMIYLKGCCQLILLQVTLPRFLDGTIQPYDIRKWRHWNCKTLSNNWICLLIDLQRPGFLKNIYAVSLVVQGCQFLIMLAKVNNLEICLPSLQCSRLCCKNPDFSFVISVQIWGTRIALFGALFYWNEMFFQITNVVSWFCCSVHFKPLSNRWLVSFLKITFPQNVFSGTSLELFR